MAEDQGGAAAARKRQRAFSLAARGAQQMDLAIRFAAAAEGRSLPVLALKGISIADELYGGMENRPMADVDFLVAAPGRFREAAEIARSLGLAEAGASDHALVFQEPASGSVLELHISLTACPGLFAVDVSELWERRVAVKGAPLFRLSDEDLVIHLALHTAFQHAFVANDLHYEDFGRLLDARRPDLDRIVERARSSGAQAALGSMVMACLKRGEPSPALRELAARAAPLCPKAVVLWIEARDTMPPPFRVRDMAFVRFVLAPSRVRFLWSTLFPAPLPGLTRSGSGRILRLLGLLRAEGEVAGREKPSLPNSLPVRTLTPEVAEPWIRECLSLDPRGAELTVTGTCMEPAIKEGTRVRLTVPDRLVRVGDVALLRTPGGLRLHRVVLRRGSTLRTKGDTGAYLDPAASTGDVIAIAAASEPRWKRASRAASSLLRLLGRPWAKAARTVEPGDPEHTRLLP
jgi:hypothetical protein